MSNYDNQSKNQTSVKIKKSSNGTSISMSNVSVENINEWDISSRHSISAKSEESKENE